MQPRFPLYIVSKGRSAYMITSKVLTRMGVRHFVVVEPEQASDYSAAVASMGLLADVIEMDMGLKASYELCDDLGLTKSTGSGPARNYARVHPDVATVAMRWGRVHHHVDYSGFKRQKLILKPDAKIPLQNNEYGMRLVTLPPKGGLEPI